MDLLTPFINRPSPIVQLAGSPFWVHLVKGAYTLFLNLSPSLCLFVFFSHSLTVVSVRMLLQLSSAWLIFFFSETNSLRNFSVRPPSHISTFLRRVCLFPFLTASENFYFHGPPFPFPANTPLVKKDDFFV